ncbi:glycosyltransferase family 61 protein [Bacillus amyloliquefaciens]|nr:glycosyltransferase family 61 protein [Bacillus amyloliquefaciens]
MKLKFKLAENYTTIQKSHEVKLLGDFVNITNNNITSPSNIHTQSCVYLHELNDALIYGGRNIIKDEFFYLDTPLEWSYENNIEYIKRVRSVHKREFYFISDEFDFLEKRPLLKLDKSIFHCGSVEHWNFGFFLTVLMPKIYYCNKIDPYKPVLVPVTKNWQVQLLKEFFAETEFIFYDPDIPVFCKQVASVSWPEFGFYINNDYLSFVRNKTYKSAFKNHFRNKKIFLSREKKHEKDGRVCLDKARHELIKKGYDIIIPEKIAYQNLFNILHSTSDLIVESGSALFNILFSDIPNVTLLESRSAFLGNHYRLGSSTSKNFKMIFFDMENEMNVTNYFE